MVGGGRAEDHGRTRGLCVWAAGGVVAAPDRATGRACVHAIFPNAVDQARVMAANILGGDVTFGVMLGKPGVMLTIPEKVNIARYFVDAVDIPVVMDCDEIGGLGPAWAVRACEEYIRAGLAGMDIDDRVPDHSVGVAPARSWP